MSLVQDSRQKSEEPYTRIPNEVISLMPKMKEAELRVVLAICRKTLGWCKEWDTISITQFMDLTGMTRQGVVNGLEGPIMRRITDRVPSGQSYSYRIKAVNEIDWSTKLTSQRSRPEVVNEVDRQLVNEVDPQKKELKKRKKGGQPSASRDSVEEEAFAEDSWQLSFANALRSRLAERGVLAKAVDRAAPKKLSSMMQKWADVFDKLHRIDGYAQAEIAEVMRWLVAPDNWWMQTGNFRSGMKLRDKPKSSEETYFDQFIIRMRQEKKAPATPPVDLRSVITTRDRDRAIREQAARGVTLTPGDFKGMAPNGRGEPMHQLMIEKRRELGLEQ